MWRERERERRERERHTHRQTQQRNKINIEQNSIRYLAEDNDLLSCMNTTAYPSVYKLRYSLIFAFSILFTSYSYSNVRYTNMLRGLDGHGHS